jgi:hypothetical protein
VALPSIPLKSEISPLGVSLKSSVLPQTTASGSVLSALNS